MDATVSVELGSDDAYLEVPWEAGDVRYYDLKRHPELLVELPEAQRNRELGEFLSAINSELSMLESAKCDAWLSDQMAEEEKVYAACCKFGSYVDLIFSDTKSRMALSVHENFGKRIARLLRRAPDLPSPAEFIIRRCYFQPGAGGDAPQDGGSAGGFYFTFYLYGYGNDQDEARRRWGIALKVVENALLQLSAMHRRGSNQTEPPPPEPYGRWGTRARCLLSKLRAVRQNPGCGRRRDGIAKTRRITDETHAPAVDVLRNRDGRYRRTIRQAG